mmetsp:Transcript_6107/g.13523  ORF Transcript_6107/g.13523 Transcript_6107/m.13523 type:complete len:404 (+) Transcript_6107:86-1297(+)
MPSWWSKAGGVHTPPPATAPAPAPLCSKDAARFFVHGIQDATLRHCYNWTAHWHGEYFEGAGNHEIVLFLAKFLNGLQLGPCAVASPDEADFFVVIDMTPWWGPYQPRQLDAEQRQSCCCSHDVHSQVRSSKWWMRHNGADHLVFAWRLNNYKLLEAYSQSAALIAGGDTTGPTQQLDPPQMVKFVRGVQIPFYQRKGSELMALRTFDERWFTASGVWGAKKGATKIRTDLARAMQGLSQAALKSPKSDSDSLSLYANSKFCICPKGDNWQSKRLYTMLQVGCVPVVCSDQFVLPMRSRIDWATTVVRVHQDECAAWVMSNLNGTGKFSRSLWWSYHTNVLRARTFLTFDHDSPYTENGGLHSLLLDAFAALPWRKKRPANLSSVDAIASGGGEEPAPDFHHV